MLLPRWAPVGSKKLGNVENRQKPQPGKEVAVLNGFENWSNLWAYFLWKWFCFSILSCSEAEV